MAAHLAIRMLGTFQLSADGIPLAGLTSPRLQAVLAYLLLHRDAPVARQSLAFLLWPESTERQAQTNLRQILHTLRHRLPDASQHLFSDEQSVQWRPAQPYTLDVADFEVALAQAGQRSGHLRAALLVQAVDAYGGDLLPALYDDWVLAAREQLSRRYLTALETLVHLSEEQRDYRQAVEFATRLRHHDPLHEITYRTLMRLHLLQGDRSAALRIYHLCAELLDHELGVEPAAATQALYRQVVENTVHTAENEVEIRRPAAGPLVGRVTEWTQVQQVWHSVERGTPHCVIICGEAGAGKTRLAEELLLWAAQLGIPSAHTRAYAAEGALAYAPAIEWLRGDVLRSRAFALEPAWREELARLMPELAGKVEGNSLAPAGSGWQRYRLFEAMTKVVAGVSSPLILVLDDLQWCDGETLEWLHFLLRYAPALRVLVVGTLRPEDIAEDHPVARLCESLANAHRLTQIDLGPLNATEIAQLAVQIAGQALPEATMARLVRETEGNPLFVVESVRAQIGMDGKGVGASSLPPTIASVIQARLQRLSPQALELAKLAAVIGRPFTFEVLAKAAGGHEDELVRSLDEMWRRRLVREQDASTYDFSHDRIRDVAYATVPPARRRLLHRRVAQGLEDAYRDNVAEIAGLLADHYTQASMVSEALRCYELAVETARQRFSARDIVSNARKGLALLTTLPETPSWQRQRLHFSIALAGSQTMIAGILEPEVLERFTTAQHLAKALGEGIHQYEAQRGLWGCYLNRLWVTQASRQAQDNLALAHALQHPRCLRDAYCNMGLAAFEVGKFQTAVDYLEQAIAQVVPPETPPLMVFGFELGLDAPFFCASAETLLGYPERARRRLTAAIAHIRTLPDLFTRHTTLLFACQAMQIARDFEAVRQTAAEVVDLSTRYTLFGLDAAIFLEWALALQTNSVAACARLQQNLDAYQQSENYQLSYYFGLAAEAHAAAGLYDEALKIVDTALALADRSGEQFWYAELLRVRGEILRALGSEGFASHFEQAVAVAHQQNACLLELRSAVSLGQCWAEQGRLHDAHQLVADVLARFTEESDAADIHSARSLLEDLHARHA